MGFGRFLRVIHQQNAIITGFAIIKKVSKLDLITRAARTLYLNRTCFRGWWRYNAQGQFNVGYGGQGRRWAITEDDLIAVSRKLENATLQDGDFENVINSSQSGDFVFVDPPYQPR